jgi:ABC-type phosphate/phosphonate transport system substrate-binding protein
VDYRREHDSCLQQVKQGHAAACITSTLTLKLVSTETSGDLRSIGDLGTVPGVVFLAHPRVPDHVRARLRNEMLSWGTTDVGRKIIGATHLGPFAPVDPTAYQNLPQLEDTP